MWYARMIRGNVIRQSDRNYILFSKAIGARTFYIFKKHIIPMIIPELIVLITLDMGVQAPPPEWGAMLNEAKNVIGTKPEQMLAPGLAIVITVAAFNLLGDSFKDNK